MSSGDASDITLRSVSVSGTHRMYAVSFDEIWLADAFKKKGTPSRICKVSVMYRIQKIYLRGLSGLDEKVLSLHNTWNARWTNTGRAMHVVTYRGSVFKLAEISHY